MTSDTGYRIFSYVTDRGGYHYVAQAEEYTGEPINSTDDSSACGCAETVRPTHPLLGPRSVNMYVASVMNMMK